MDRLEVEVETLRPQPSNAVRNAGISAFRGCLQEEAYIDFGGRFGTSWGRGASCLHAFFSGSPLLQNLCEGPLFSPQILRPGPRARSSGRSVRISVPHRILATRLAGGRVWGLWVPA